MKEPIQIQAERYLKVLNSKYLIPIIYFFIVCSLLISFYSNNPNWLSASGGVLAIIGLLITIKTSTLYRATNLYFLVSASNRDPAAVEDPFMFGHLTEKEKKDKITKELKTELRGIKLTVFGTLVWAYGFLLPTIDTFIKT